MSAMTDEVGRYLDDYRASKPDIRNGKRGNALFEYHKWVAIRDGIMRIDKEVD